MRGSSFFDSLLIGVSFLRCDCNDTDDGGNVVFYEIAARIDYCWFSL